MSISPVRPLLAAGPPGRTKHRPGISLYDSGGPEGQVNATWFSAAVSDIVPLLAAALLGGLVGWERESLRKPAGLRTNMIVAVGAATFTLLSLRMAEQNGTAGADPTRIIQAVATGIGFLGAGSIIHSHGEVSGVTTAAGIWLVGAIGVSCGAGAYDIATVAVLLGLTILTILHRLSRRISGQAEPDGEERSRAG